MPPLLSSRRPEDAGSSATRLATKRNGAKCWHGSRRNARLVFAELSRLLGGKTHLAREEATLADLLVASQLDFIAGTPEWPLLTAERPNLVTWLERMRARPSFQATTWECVAEMANAA